ncbi:uncharacterized protein LOC113642536 [Tachysurus fulvidraco]|uniref:uncharacterized protein LOC113642536 n=1 Tax=Tachysurus fulvidraco TaxID=1234273 RepID=UPI000F4E7FDF|nr:uncharacterized protein LOC113642536 [Tachysurus fulvidraco]
MSKPKTLNELKHLKKSGFGQRYPRHGLKLLYWFANDCVYFDDYNNMRWQYDPEEGHFDFHLFRNRTERNGEKLLPDVDLDYYEVGNLSRPEADDLPDYVLEDYNQNPDHCESNMERIIFSVDDECIDRVYVTEHIDQADFNKEATFGISRGLITIIRQLRTLEDFLKKTGYYTDEEDSDQEPEYRTPQNVFAPVFQGVVIQLSDHQQVDRHLNSGGLGPVVEEVDEESDSSFMNDEPNNCCKCIIL